MSVDPTNKPAFPAKPAPIGINAGAVAIESDRAIAEAQGRLTIAKRFPRDETKAFQRVVEACSRMSLAESAAYAYPRAGQTVTGPSIRLAEELARCWGNISYGITELSRGDGYSEMEAWASDDEANVRTSQKFTVRHVRDTKGGGKALSDERDVYEITANMGGRRLRARILAVLPTHIKDEAIEQCKRTLAGKTEEPLADRINKAVAYFARLGVTADKIEKRIGRQISEMTPDDLADLRAVLNSLKDGAAKIDDFFPRPEAETRPQPGDRMRGIVQAKREEQQSAGDTVPGGDEGDAPI
jgi:hypothetical protein